MLFRQKNTVNPSRDGWDTHVPTQSLQPAPGKISEHGQTFHVPRSNQRENEAPTPSEILMEARHPTITEHEKSVEIGYLLELQYKYRIREKL